MALCTSHDIISYRTYNIIQNAKKDCYRNFKKAAASADAAHQRQLLLAAAAGGTSRKCVSHDARKSYFRRAHARTDTYIPGTEREFPKFDFKISNRAKTKQLSAL